MVLNIFGALVALLHVSLALHGLGDCNIEVSTEKSLSIDPKEDITEVTFEPSVNLSISNINGEPFKPSLACNHYGLFVFFVVNAKGKEILRYPADVGSAISMWLMSSGKTAVSISIDVKQNGTCDFQYVRNKMADIAYKILETNTTHASNKLYMCRYHVDQTFAYTAISSTLYQLFVPYFQWNTFDTFCAAVDDKAEELLPQSPVSYLIFATSIILLVTFPVLAAILPECPKADLRYYKKYDIPFSFRMLLIIVVHFNIANFLGECKDWCIYCCNLPKKCSPAAKDSSVDKCSRKIKYLSGKEHSDEKAIRFIVQDWDNYNKITDNQNTDKNTDNQNTDNQNTDNQKADNQNTDNQKTDNQNTDHPNTEEFSRSFRYFLLLIVVLMVFNTIVHYTIRSRDTWEFQLVHETLSNAAVPIEADYLTQVIVYYGVLALSFFILFILLIVFYCTKKECQKSIHELFFKAFQIEDMKKVYVMSRECTTCILKDIDVNMRSENEYTFHTRCLKLIENSLFSYTFWKASCKGFSQVCSEKESEGGVFECAESNECCLKNRKSCVCRCTDKCCCSNKCFSNSFLCVLACIMCLINIPLVLIQSIPIVRAGIVTPCMIVWEKCECKCCKNGKCEYCFGKLWNIFKCFFYILILVCVHVLVCEIIITSVQFVLQITVFTFFVSVAFYPSASLPQITLILAFVKVLVEAWHAFQTDMELVLNELFEKPEHKFKLVSKQAFAYVFEMINGPSILLHFAKFLFLTFTFYVTYDAVIKGGIIKDNWQTVFASIFLFFTPELLVKITGMTKETKKAIISEQLELFFINKEYEKHFNELNQQEVQVEMDQSQPTSNS